MHESQEKAAKLQTDIHRQILSENIKVTTGAISTVVQMHGETNLYCDVI
jgi:hypothetical protein